ncbi:hypothetical protein Cgig2_003949 [Carnegiea gigantea]|uniref:ENTH domain-containing protein n=1 Tax=Carnegiea gigantea TaxID=171969 RepID=A0A9Q1KAN8_9CARY|nr:hypothetical protein Cgig2_003949 [Carnegiea gigantea]
MSELGFNCNNSSRKMSSFLEFRKQASFYIKEKIKTARLALTDVTPAQLLTEEATNANPWAPDARTLGLISKSAFEVDDYWRIVDILHNKLSKFDRKNWRTSYNALVVLEHLLTHGPDSSERVLKLLEKGALLKVERENARKLTRGIQGFGSFSGVGRSTTPLKESSTAFGRSHSQFNEHGNEDNIPESRSSDRPPLIFVSDQDVKPDESKIMKGMSKENKAPRNDIIRENLHTWDNDDIGEGNSLLCGGGVLIEEENHPFNHIEKHSRVSLLAAQAED